MLGLVTTLRCVNRADMKRWTGATPITRTEDHGGEFKRHDYEELPSPQSPE